MARLFLFGGLHSHIYHGNAAQSFSQPAKTDEEDFPWGWVSTNERAPVSSWRVNDSLIWQSTGAHGKRISAPLSWSHLTHPHTYMSLFQLFAIHANKCFCGSSGLKERQQPEITAAKCNIGEKIRSIWHKSQGFPKEIEKRIQFNILLLLSKIGISRK